MAHFETARADWLSYPAALAFVMDQASPLPPESVPVESAVGRYLAEDVVAPATLPPFDNSAMDGYAIRSSDLEGRSPPLTLPVTDVSLPGSAPLGDVPAGSAVRIMTGGPLPTGFDTVIRVEHTDAESTSGSVTLERLDDLRKHVRPAGRDMLASQRVLSEGTLVRPGGAGLLTACGRQAVRVRRRPVVGVLSTGDELVSVEDFERVRSGRGVPDTNRVTLRAALAVEGAVAEDLGIVPDEADALARAVGDLPPLDAVVTTGGASMGERDLLKRTLAEAGFELGFWRTLIRPGSPFSFGHLVRPGAIPLPVFGLPGNPASAFVTFHVLVAPFLRRLSGSQGAAPPRITAIAGERLQSPEHLTHFFRIRLLRDPVSGTLECRLTGDQSSGLISPLAEAGALAVVPEGVTTVEAGEPVEVVLLPGLEVRELEPRFVP